MKVIFSGQISLLYEFPGGNQVDGLPPAAGLSFFQENILILLFDADSNGLSLMFSWALLSIFENPQKFKKIVVNLKVIFEMMKICHFSRKYC